MVFSLIIYFMYSLTAFLQNINKNKKLAMQVPEEFAREVKFFSVD